MGKKIVSPVEAFPGYVLLRYPITFPLYAVWEDALSDRKLDDKGEPVREVKYGRVGLRYVPAFIELVEEWHIEGIPERPTIDTFPAAPPATVGALVGWLIGEINAAIFGNNKDAEDDQADDPFLKLPDAHTET